MLLTQHRVVDECLSPGAMRHLTFAFHLGEHRGDGGVGQLPSFGSERLADVADGGLLFLPQDPHDGQLQRGQLGLFTHGWRCSWLSTTRVDAWYYCGKSKSRRNVAISDCGF